MSPCKYNHLNYQSLMHFNLQESVAMFSVSFSHFYSSTLSGLSVRVAMP